MRRIQETPWKFWNELERWWAYPGVRLAFALNGIPWGQGWRFHGAPIVQKHRGSRMRFGDGFSLRSSLRSNPLGPSHAVILCTWQAGALLETGVNFAMTGGSLVAAEQILIGNDVAVGANTIISDTDFHPLAALERRENPSAGKTAPIVIEDDVFIGMNCLVLKGVRLGRGCVIGAGSVVTRDIPAGMIAAGNPAKIIRSI